MTARTSKATVNKERVAAFLNLKKKKKKRKKELEACASFLSLELTWEENPHCTPQPPLYKQQIQGMDANFEVFQD